MVKGRGQKWATTDSLTPTLMPDADIDAVYWHMDLILNTMPSLIIIIDQVTIWPQVKPILLPTLQNSTWKKWKPIGFEPKKQGLHSLVHRKLKQRKQRKRSSGPVSMHAYSCPKLLQQNGDESRLQWHKHLCYTRLHAAYTKGTKNAANLIVPIFF